MFFLPIILCRQHLTIKLLLKYRRLLADGLSNSRLPISKSEDQVRLALIRKY